MKISPEDRDRALDIGLTASYKVKSHNYMGGNFENKVRVGIEAALDYLDSLRAGCDESLIASVASTLHVFERPMIEVIGHDRYKQLEALFNRKTTAPDEKTVKLQIGESQ
jgi:hypothetical protein